MILKTIKENQRRFLSSKYLITNKKELSIIKGGLEPIEPREADLLPDQGCIALYDPCNALSGGCIIFSDDCNGFEGDCTYFG